MKMISEYWALIATYSDETTALLLSQRCGTIQIKHTYKDKNDTITTINGVKSYVVKSDGVQYWYKGGKRHREDGPAVIYPDDYQCWYKGGKHHREDEPAVIQKWYKENKLHREDGPAIIWADGSNEWYKDGELHREDPVGPPSGYGPAIIFPDGSKEWYKDGYRLSRS